MWQTYQINEILKLKIHNMHMLIKKQCILYAKKFVVCINVHFGTISLSLTFCFSFSGAYHATSSILSMWFVLTKRWHTVYNIYFKMMMVENNMRASSNNNNNYNNIVVQHIATRISTYTYYNEQWMTMRAHWVTKVKNRTKGKSVADCIQ